MADVPGILIVGDQQVQGGGAEGVVSSVSAVAVADMDKFNDLTVLRVTPDNPSTGASTSASLSWFPWYDGANDSVFHAISASTSTTATVSPSPGWTTNEFVGRAVTIINAVGLGFSQRAIITANTADTVTVGSWPAGTPTVGHPLFVGRGRFTDYHPVAGWLPFPEIGVAFSTRGGSSWQALGLGVGIDAGLVRQLYEHVYPTAPFFQIAKFANGTAPTVGGWDDATGSLRGLFEAELTRINAAWTPVSGGNTLAWDLLIFDHSQRDVIDWVSTPANFLLYENALEQAIAYFRTQLGNANLKVLLINHDIGINNVTAPTGTLLANRVHRTVALQGANIRCVSMQGERLGAPSPTVWQPSENRGHYASSVYWDQMAVKVRKSYELMLLGAAAAVDGGIPVYILIGDSIAAGQISEQYLTDLNSPTLTVGPRASEQGIWNPQTGAVEAYDPGDNSNTSGSLTTNSGLECSALVDLEALHPASGLVLIKRGAGASSLAAELSPYDGNLGGVWSKGAGEHYNELQALVAGAFQYINSTLGKQADLKGIFVALGTNDGQIGAAANGGALFANELATFVADLRADFSTRTSGDALPIVWLKPQLGFANSDDDELRIIRQALEDLAAVDEQFVVRSVDDLERDSTDNIHLNDDAEIEAGQRLVAALAAPVGI